MLLLVGIHQLNVFVLVSVLFVLLMAKDWNTETEVSIHHFSVFILVSLLMVKD